MYLVFGAALGTLGGLFGIGGGLIAIPLLGVLCGLDQQIAVLEKEVWKETDCLSCANCCKTMTPTFTNTDIKRIAAHLGQTPDAFKEKWLKRERGGDRDWLNKTEPCQFLNLKDNKCSIYEVRPADCAGFPHLHRKFTDYAHVHKQNVEYCPATYRLVEKMIVASAGGLSKG